jgi:hypothetical protein
LARSCRAQFWSVFKYDRPLDLVKAPRVLTQYGGFVFAF